MNYDDLVTVKFQKEDDDTTFSFNDTYLVSRTIGSPEVQTYEVEIPGKDGMLDLTESLDGFIHYSNREVEMTFKVMDPLKSSQDRFYTYSTIYKRLHGKTLKIWFSDYEEDEYYLYGRCTIEDIEFSGDNPWGFYYTVVADCEPWWYEAEETEVEVDLTENEDKEIMLSDLWDKSDSDSVNKYTYYCGSADGTSEPCVAYSYLKYYWAESPQTFTALQLWDTDGNNIKYYPKKSNGGDYITEEGYWTIERGEDSEYAEVTCDGAASITQTKYSGDGIVFDKIYKVGLSIRRYDGAETHYLSAVIPDCVTINVTNKQNHPSPDIWSPLDHVLISNGTDWFELSEGWNNISGLYIPEDTSLYNNNNSTEMYVCPGYDDDGDLISFDDAEENLIIKYRGGRL